MIRRGFWLTAGAVTGIWGYRRVAAAGRRVSASLTPGGTLKLADTRTDTRADTRAGESVLESHGQLSHPSIPKRLGHCEQLEVERVTLDEQ